MPSSAASSSGVKHSRLVVIYAALLLSFLTALAGCTNDEEISRYRVPKQRVLEKSIGVTPSASGTEQQGTAATARMLAAIVPGKDQTWFFKVSGPDDAVAAQKETFQTFIQSVNFSGPDGATPQWSLPEGWHERPGSAMRYATFQIGTDEAPLELTVIPLPNVGGAEDEYVLSNVNRWRGQLSLRPIALDELLDDESSNDEISRIELEDGTKVTMVNFVGTMGPNQMAAPFASASRGAPAAARPLGPQRPQPAAGPASMDNPISYDVPDGWEPGKAGGLRKASFEVTDDGRQVEITVIPLPASDLLSNIHRWCGQVQLPAKRQEEIDQQVEPIEVDQITGHFIELVGPEDAVPRETILGVSLNRGNTSWFFKLKGDVDLAAREKERFKAFVQSVKFKANDGAGDGN